MSQEPVVIRFNQVSFEYPGLKTILDEASFSVHKNSIVTIVGQNGAGKSTIFKLLMGELIPQSGKISLELGSKIGIAKQVVPPEMLNSTVVEFFQTTLPDVEFGIEGDIKKIFATVGLDIPLTRKISELSGGQKARLLLAQALITDPDILLLDEPTNNLDAEGVGFLTTFLMNYPKTCIVISHDADFLNCFTDGVLNLDIHTHKVEQFVGNYYDVIEEIATKLERDRRENARVEKSIRDRFEKINKLGGKSVAMSQLARRMRVDIEKDKEGLVEMRREDKTLPDFQIENQGYVGYVIKIKSPVPMLLENGLRLQIKGPNGIGKSTLLRSFLKNESADINPAVRVGYYSQDFSELNFDETVFESLSNIDKTKTKEEIYKTASKFLLHNDLMTKNVESLSEGQKGLLCYARLFLQKPGLLILDEPTNHINFRHIPVITKAIDDYKGPIIFVSHLQDFYENIKDVRVINLGKEQ